MENNLLEATYTYKHWEFQYFLLICSNNRWKSMWRAYIYLSKTQKQEAMLSHKNVFTIDEDSRFIIDFIIIIINLLTGYLESK